MKPVRVIIADDHALVRTGITTYLQASKTVQLLGEAESGEDAIQLCEMLKPDVVLLDDYMPGMDGLMTAKVIHKRWPKIAVLMLLSDLKKPLVQAALESGAAGYLSKNITPEQLHAAIQNAFEKQPIPSEAPLPADRQAPAPTWEHDLDEQRTSVELEMAGRIQAKILPEDSPQIPGWDIGAALEPAYETSGDFYDFIPLAYGKMGIAIGDVTNKGLGAAIYMALCSSLMRTYATHFPIMPGMTLNAVNERLNTDSRSGMFVTAFYAVLDPKLNRLIYVNAGHNPPILVSDNKGKPVDYLGTTGTALGILNTGSWQQKIAKFAPGDLLLLYTDGVTEAQNPTGEFFGEERLLSHLRSLKGKSSKAIIQGLLRAVDRFSQGAPRQDDIALIVIARTN